MMDSSSDSKGEGAGSRRRAKGPARSMRAPSLGSAAFRWATASTGSKGSLRLRPLLIMGGVYLKCRKRINCEENSHVRGYCWARGRSSTMLGVHRSKGEIDLRSEERRVGNQG